MVESLSADFLPAIESYWTVAFVKYQRRSSSAKICGASLDDWVNDGYFDSLLHLW